MTVEVSIPIISYRPDKLLLKTLQSISKSDFPKKKYEIVVAYDHEAAPEIKDEILKIVKENNLNFRMKKISPGRGLGYSRNRSLEMAKGKYFIVTDGDCTIQPTWLSTLYTAIKNSPDDVAVIVGGAHIPKSTFLGDCISLLGFPAGGNVGFDKIHRVNKEGYTKQITNCNCAMKRELITKVGGYHENAYDLEDKGLALKLYKAGYKVKFMPGIEVTHIARTSFRSFCTWMKGRGRAARIFLRNHKDYQGELFSTRLWSMKNVILAARPLYRLPVVLFLLATSYFFQFIGYTSEALRPSKEKKRY